MLITKLSILSTCSSSIHLVAVEGRYTLEGLCTHDIVEILVQIEVGDILTDFLTTASHHGRHATGHPCGSCAPDAPVDRRLKSSLAAECEAERVGDVCPRILGLLSTADDDLLDIVKVVIGIERCAISLLQPERVDISRELCCQLRRQSSLTLGETLAAIRIAIQPFISHVCMVEIRNRAIADACKDVITLISCAHCLEQGLVRRVIARGSHEA